MKNFQRHPLAPAVNWTILPSIPSDPSVEAIKRCYDLEYLLLGDLRQLVDEPPTAQTRFGMLVTLDRLLENLPRRLELTSEQGYMAEVLEERPNWHDRIENLLDANRDCISRLDELRRRIARELPFAETARRVSQDLREWMDSLESIREHEGQMLQNAFALDIGGEA